MKPLATVQPVLGGGNAPHTDKSMAKSQPQGTIRLPIPLPVKGLNRNFSRSNQPEATCWDALNILPIDRQGRLRLALRGGAALIDTLDAAAKVRLLHVASTIGGISGTFIDELWPYSLGDLATTGSTSWVNFSGSGNSFKTTGSGTLTVTSPAALSGAMTIDNSAVFNATNLTITFPLLLQTPANTTASTEFIVFLDSGWQFQIQHRNNSGSPQLFIGILDPNFISDNVITSSANGNGSYSIVITGLTATVSRDSVQVLTHTSSTPVSASTTLTIGYTAPAVSGTSIFVINGEFLATGSGGNKSILKLVAVSGTDTYLSTDPTSLTEVSNDGTYPINANSEFVSAATLFLNTYIVDGTNLYQLDLDTEQFVAYAASAGDAPTGCTIAVAWRGRLILSGDSTDPQNVFASKVGDPTNWDEGVDPPTETMAWSANAANLGRIGEPVLALIPLSDDILLIGCEQSIWAVRGDPAADGSIDNISESAGILSQKAWCRAADGSVYFVGPNGLYKAAPDGSGPIEISRDVFRQFFRTINRNTDNVTLVFDKERYGIWIFVTPEDSSDAPGSHLFYDLRLEGYWPIEFTNIPLAGPIHAVHWDGFDADTKYPILGGYDGKVYSVNFTDTQDNDGTAHQIGGYIVLGPVSLSNVDDATLTKLDITAGELASGDTGLFEMVWTVNGGESAYTVTEGTPLITATGTFSAGGRAQTQYPRVRGGWFTIKLATGNTSGDYFSVENVVAQIMPSGIQRV